MGQVKMYVAAKSDVFPPAVCSMLKEYLYRGPDDTVFTWPWNLLRLAATDSGMVEDVRGIVETLINNQQSILYQKSLKDSIIYQPVVVDAVRDCFQSLLGYLLQNLPHDSAQLLFTTLSDTLPFPLRNSLDNFDTHREHVTRIARNILYGQELRDSYKERPPVLPYCDPLWHPQIQAREEFQQAAEVQSDLLNAVTARICVKAEHITFIVHLGEIVEKDNSSLYFQLQLLRLRLSACSVGYHTYGYEIRQSFCKLQLGTPGGQLAFRYLVNNWQYCLEPLEVIEFLTDSHTASEGHSCKEEMAQLISDVTSNHPKKILPSLHSQQLKKVIQMLSSHNNPEHLLSLVDAFDINLAAAEDLEQLARAVGRMFRVVTAKSPIESGSKEDSEDTCSRLKATCVRVLANLVVCITKPDDRLKYFRVHPLMRTQYRPKNRLQSIDIHEWASIASAVGEDAIENLLKVLHAVHQVKSLKRFSYQFCQDLGVLWTTYHQTLPTSSRNILDLAAFKDTIAPLLVEKEENARNCIQRQRKNGKKAKEALLLLASIYQPLHLDKNFASFAFEMCQGCSAEVKHMIEKKFVHTPLSDLEIPKEMHERLARLDAQGNARHEVEEEPDNVETESSTQPQESDAHLLQQLVYMQYAARMREQYEQNMNPFFGYGGYHDDWYDY